LVYNATRSPRPCSASWSSWLRRASPRLKRLKAQCAGDGHSPAAGRHLTV